MGRSTQWEAQVTHFVGMCDVITPELPGFDANSHTAPLRSIRAYAIRAINESRKQEVKRYHLLSYSMGGIIVRKMARMDQDKFERQFFLTWNSWCLARSL